MTVVDGYVLDVLNRLAELLVVAHTDFIFVAVLAIVCQRAACHAVAEIGSGCLHVKSVEGELLAVEVDAVFGSILVAADAHLRAAVLAEHLCRHVGGNAVGRSEVVAIDFNLHRRLAADSAATAAGGNVERADFRILVQVVADSIANLAERPLALRRAHGADVVLQDVVAVVLHTAEDVVLAGLSL